MDKLAISLEGNIDDRLASMKYLVKKLLPLRNLTAGTTAALDLSKLRYLGPDGVVMIAGSIVDAQQRGVQVQVNRPAQPNSLVGFLEFSGFNHLVLGTPLPDLTHPENVTVPLRRFVQSRHDDPEPIIRLVERFHPVSDDLRFSLEISVNECVQNIEDHALSAIGGMGCARFMKQSQQVRVSLVDWGQGILSSLRRRHSDTTTSEHALRRVLYGGYSARTKINNQGRGIDNLRSIATEAFGGNLFIFSGDGAVEIQGHRPPKYFSDPSNYFQGTVVCFTLPVQPRNQ